VPTGRKHLTRHEMKQDEFVSWIQSASLWIEGNRNTVLGIAGGVVVIIAAVIGVIAWRQSEQEKAFTLLGRVQKIARQPIAGDGASAPGAFATAKDRAAAVVEAADTMLRTYGRGPASDWARYHRAAALLEMGRKDEAAETLAPVLQSADPGLLSSLSRLLSGRIEEARGNYDKAASEYALAATTAGPDFPPEVALMDQARCLSSAGKTQDALAAYQKILDTYPASPLASKISQRIQELKGGGPGSS